MICGKPCGRASAAQRAYYEESGKYQHPDIGWLECVKDRGHPGGCWAPRPDGLFWSPSVMLDEHHFSDWPFGAHWACEDCSGSPEWKAAHPDEVSNPYDIESIFNSGPGDEHYYIEIYR